MTTRRTFLKLAGAAVTAMGITRYAEPAQMIPEALARHEWIEDRGDFYVVRVPDFKTFAREHLDKPTIFILGSSAVLSEVSVEGFANIAAKPQSSVLDCHFDASKIDVQRDRAVVEISATTKELVLSRCNLLGNRPPFTPRIDYADTIRNG